MMRVEPDGVYLELREPATLYNLTTGATRAAPAVTIHFKDGARWRRSTIYGDAPDSGTGDTLGAILARVGAWIDQHGVTGALAQITERRS